MNGGGSIEVYEWWNFGSSVRTEFSGFVTVVGVEQKY